MTLGFLRQPNFQHAMPAMKRADGAVRSPCAHEIGMRHF